MAWTIEGQVLSEVILIYVIFKISQSIFCISNITPKKRALPLSAVNLIETENWFDLISGTPLSNYRGELQLAPYQTLWITNSKQAAS